VTAGRKDKPSGPEHHRPFQMVYAFVMTDRGGAPTDRVWAVYFLYAQSFPVSISLDQRRPDDAEPYAVTIADGEDVFIRLSDDEVSWLIAKKVGVS
jgi:hypothetical protein